MVKGYVDQIKNEDTVRILSKLPDLQLVLINKEQVSAAFTSGGKPENVIYKGNPF